MWRTAHLFVTIGLPVAAFVTISLPRGVAVFVMAALYTGGKNFSEGSKKMVIFQITAFLILLLVIGRKFRIPLVEAVPVGSVVLTLLLYLLSFFRALSFSDVAALLVTAAGAAYLLLGSREKRREILAFLQRELSSPGFVAALLMTILMAVCVGGKVVSWWDDYNFWATDVKSLYYLDGFAGRYANVAAEFGDYPPGTQMMKWWFLHFSGEFREGLMFAGYYFLNLSFLFPFLKVLKKWDRLTLAGMLAGGAALWLFPAVAEVFWTDGCCADLTMALVYGGFLAAAADRQGHGRFFYYGRQGLYLMLLVLCKNTGFLWAAFGLLFTYGYHFLCCRKENTQKEERKRDRKALFWVTICPVAAEGSWLGFCLLNRRVAKLTGAAIQMATGAMGIPAVQEKMVRAFGEAFTKWPLHRGKTPGLDLTPLGLYVLLLVFVFLLYRFRVLAKGQAVYAGSFLAVTGAVFYGINLASHLTIFAVETQYLEPFGMISSIERYGAPFAIGGLYLIAFYLTRGGESLKGVLICTLFVFLATDHGGAYRALLGYREAAGNELARREEILDDKARQFLEAIGAGGKEGDGHVEDKIAGHGRVLYLRDISDVSWVRNTYINYEAAPVSVMYGNVDVSSMDSGDILKALEDAHAGFLYVDELAKGGRELLAPLAWEGDFAYGCLYQAVEGEHRIYLVKRG